MGIAHIRRYLSSVLVAMALVVSLSFSAAVLKRFAPQPKSRDAVQTPANLQTSNAELVRQGDEALRTRRAEQALVAYRQALALKPDSIPAQLGVAQGELMAGREETAGEEYERLLQIAPGHREALLQLANLYAKRSQTWGKAERRFREFLKLAPSDADAELGLAQVLGWSGNAAQAADLFARPEVNSRLNAAQRREYVFCLVKAKRYSQAEPLLRSIVDAHPADAEMAIQLASLYADRKNWTAAVPLYRRGLALRPSDPALKFNYGLGLSAIGTYHDALGPLGEATAALPGRPEIGLAYARALKGTGDLKRASKELERVLPSYSLNALVLREYADLMMERKKYAAATLYYRSAESRGLHDDRLNVGLAGALLSDRKYKEALPYLEKAYHAAPTARRALDLAKAYSKTGRKNEAMAMLAKAESALTRRETMARNGETRNGER